MAVGLIGCLFQFEVISEVWLPLIMIYLKNDHCKKRNVGLAEQWWEKESNAAASQTKIF